MKKRKLINAIRARRQARNSLRIVGFSARLRLAINRSNTSTYAQLIDDERGNTLISVSSREISAKGESTSGGKDGKKSKTEAARMAGELLAKRAALKGIKKVVFDRRGYRYHGRVRAFAEGARSGGLNF
ncbi:MAG: 50S ribosomal protein L18 [Patescibacteria group bacterium]